MCAQAVHAHGNLSPQALGLFFEIGIIFYRCPLNGRIGGEGEGRGSPPAETGSRGRSLRAQETLLNRHSE